MFPAASVTAALTSAMLVACALPALAAPASVSGMTYDESQRLITIGLAGSVSVRTQRIKHPDRLVVDLTEARLPLGQPAPSLQVKSSRIRSVRMAQNSFVPAVVRVVVDLAPGFEPMVKISQPGGKLLITLADPLLPQGERDLESLPGLTSPDATQPGASIPRVPDAPIPEIVTRLPAPPAQPIPRPAPTPSAAPVPPPVPKPTPRPAWTPPPVPGWVPRSAPSAAPTEPRPPGATPPGSPAASRPDDPRPPTPPPAWTPPSLENDPFAKGGSAFQEQAPKPPAKESEASEPAESILPPERRQAGGHGSNFQLRWQQIETLEQYGGPAPSFAYPAGINGFDLEHWFMPYVGAGLDARVLIYDLTVESVRQHRTDAALGPYLALRYPLGILEPSLRAGYMGRSVTVESESTGTTFPFSPLQTYYGPTLTAKLAVELLPGFGLDLHGKLLPSTQGSLYPGFPGIYPLSGRGWGASLVTDVMRGYLSLGYTSEQAASADGSFTQTFSGITLGLGVRY